MAKLYFRYGAMNSGKSTALLQAAHNYEERGQHVLLAKPAVDTRGDSRVVSRLGVTREVDFLIEPGDDVLHTFLGNKQRIERERGIIISCLLIDEAQFLSGRQVEQLFRVAVSERIPVLTYGIRTDFQTRAFPGSARLLELSHTLEEMKTICRCGRKALLNGRKRDGHFIAEGSQIAMDEDADVTYESLCGACYMEEVAPLGTSSDA